MSDISASMRKSLGIGNEIFDGFVTAVNDDNTCDVKMYNDDNYIIPNISLRSVADGDNIGVIVVPAIDSHVVFAAIEGQSDYVVLKTSKIDKVIVNAPDVIINQGENGGLVKVAALTSRLNALEQDLNTLKQVFATWSVALNDGGGALKFKASDWYSKLIELSDTNDLQNTTVKH